MRPQFTWLFDDWGVPLNYRHMEGFGVHTFKLINREGKETYCKFHWKPKCGEWAQLAWSTSLCWWVRLVWWADAGMRLCHLHRH